MLWEDGGLATEAVNIHNALRPQCCRVLAQANEESGLSGSLNLGHYGVTQSNSFESVKVGGQGAELVTPFAKLQVPYTVRFLRTMHP